MIFDPFVSGGYYLARPMRRPDTMNADLVPPRIITASSCLVDLIPETWAISWSGDTEETRRDIAARVGLDDEALADFTRWTTDALESGELGWPGVFFDVNIARAVRARFFAEDEEIVTFGIALEEAAARRFLHEWAPEPDLGTPGVPEALRSNCPPEPGRPLGFDILGWNVGGFHSYLCNSLENEFDSVFGVRPNELGFFDVEEEAKRLAEHADQPSTGAEPGIWLPWLVVEYDADTTFETSQEEGGSS